MREETFEKQLYERLELAGRKKQTVIDLAEAKVIQELGQRLGKEGR